MAALSPPYSSLINTISFYYTFFPSRPVFVADFMKLFDLFFKVNWAMLFLDLTLSNPIWRCYINFIRKANEKKGLEGQEETRKAFEFMLGYVGSDIGSGPVWTDYINFLKSLLAQNPQEESQRMIVVRKVYQKAIVTPTHHIEQHWRDYENFENSVSRAQADG